MEDRGWSVDLGGKRIELPPMPQMPRIPRLPRGGALLILTVAAVLIGIVTGYYQVEPDEVAVVQRFGKFARTTEPGPHIKIPFGVEQITKVPVKRQLKMEFGFRTARAAALTTYAPPSPADQRRGANAHRRPQRRDRRVDRPVPDQGSGSVPVSRARRPGDVPVHVRGVDAPGRRRSQRRRGPDHRTRGDRLESKGAAAVCAICTTSASRSSSSCSRT